jgi:hypothetical protein
MALRTLTSFSTEQRGPIWFAEDSLEKTLPASHIDFARTLPSTDSERCEFAGLVFFSAGLAIGSAFPWVQKLQGRIREEALIPGYFHGASCLEFYHHSKAGICISVSCRFALRWCPFVAVASP